MRRNPKVQIEGGEKCSDLSALLTVLALLAAAAIAKLGAATQFLHLAHSHAAGLL
jgi:hypothetical protein